MDGHATLGQLSSRFNWPLEHVSRPTLTVVDVTITSEAYGCIKQLRPMLAHAYVGSSRLLRNGVGCHLPLPLRV